MEENHIKASGLARMAGNIACGLVTSIGLEHLTRAVQMEVAAVSVSLAAEIADLIEQHTSEEDKTDVSEGLTDDTDDPEDDDDPSR